MKQAIIYCRVSTAKQAAEGVSLDAQQAACEEFCQRNGWRVVGIYIEEGVSGRKAVNRPQLKRALAQVCEYQGILVFYSLSRLARSMKDTFVISEQINGCGGQLASVTDQIDTTSAMGKFYFSLLAALARLESDIVSERIKASNEYQVKQKGFRCQGEQPFGLRYDKELGERVEVPEEQAIIAQVMELRASNTLHTTAKRLNELGVPTPNKMRHGHESKWKAAIVRKIALRAKAKSITSPRRSFV